MKHWIKSLAVVVLMAVFLPVSARAAEGGSGLLTADGTNVSLAVSLPEGQTETITSLRLKLLVTVESGAIGAPEFQFKNTLQSEIRDAAVSKNADGSYLVDVILSGKQNQDIFNRSAYAEIGTLAVPPAAEEYRVKVAFAGEGSQGGTPAACYMDAGGLEEVQVTLSDASPVVLEKKKTADAGQAEDPFLSRKPKLKTIVKTGSKSVIFEWKEIEGAAGYEIAQYQAKTKTYKKIKTVNNPDVTAYSKKFSYAASYSFKMRAYKAAPDGEKQYGPYSAVVKTTLPPAKAKGVAVKSKDAKKATLSWKKVSGAKGYQIYRSKKKKGKYKLLKTIKKGKTKSYSVTKPKGNTTYYYKVRAYVTNTKNKKVYGSFSTVKSLKAGR